MWRVICPPLLLLLLLLLPPPFYGLLSGTTRVSRYQKKHSPTHTYPDHQSSLISFLHLRQSIASSLFNLRALQPSGTPAADSQQGAMGHSLASCASLLHNLSPRILWSTSFLHPTLHTPYISSLNHCHLFATHAHTIATCFALLMRLWQTTFQTVC